MGESDNRWLRRAGPVWGLPFLVPIAVALGCGLGWWLDSKLGTEPWLAVVFGLLGFVAGVYESAKVLLDATRDDK